MPSASHQPALGAVLAACASASLTPSRAPCASALRARALAALVDERPLPSGWARKALAALEESDGEGRRRRSKLKALRGRLRRKKEKESEEVRRLVEVEVAGGGRVVHGVVCEDEEADAEIDEEDEFLEMVRGSSSGSRSSGQGSSGSWSNGSWSSDGSWSSLSLDSFTTEALPLKDGGDTLPLARLVGDVVVDYGVVFVWAIAYAMWTFSIALRVAGESLTGFSSFERVTAWKDARVAGDVEEDDRLGKK